MHKIFLKKSVTTPPKVGFSSKFILLVAGLVASSCAEEPETKYLRNSESPKNIDSADGTLQDEATKSTASNPKQANQDETAENLVD